MNEREKILEDVIKQMLNPIKNLPLDLIVESISNFKVIPFNSKNDKDLKLLRLLEQASLYCCEDLYHNPIDSKVRVNEVGNQMENYLIKSLLKAGLKAEKPKGKSTGYPDILVLRDENYPVYIECKTFNNETLDSTQRTFYLSPSNNFKVDRDANHIVISFEIELSSRGYIAKAYKIVDVSSLLCDVKYEFNSNNKRLYSKNLVISENIFTS